MGISDPGARARTTRAVGKVGGRVVYAPKVVYTPSGRPVIVSETSPAVQKQIAEEAIRKAGGTPAEPQETITYTAEIEPGKPVRVSKGVYEKIQAEQAKAAQPVRPTLQTGEQVREQYKGRVIEQLKTDPLSPTERETIGKIEKYPGGKVAGVLYEAYVGSKTPIAEVAPIERVLTRKYGDPERVYQKMVLPRQALEKEFQEATLEYERAKATEGWTYPQYFKKIKTGAKLGAFKLASAPVETGTALIAFEAAPLGILSTTASGMPSIATSLIATSIALEGVQHPEETLGAVGAFLVGARAIRGVKTIPRARAETFKVSKLKSEFSQAELRGKGKTTISESIRRVKVDIEQKKLTTRYKYEVGGFEEVTGKVGEGYYKVKVREIEFKEPSFVRKAATAIAGKQQPPTVKTFDYKGFTETKSLIGKAGVKTAFETKFPEWRPGEGKVIRGVQKSKISKISDVSYSFEREAIVTSSDKLYSPLKRIPSKYGEFASRRLPPTAEYGYPGLVEARIKETGLIGKKQVISYSGIMARVGEKTITVKTGEYQELFYKGFERGRITSEFITKQDLIKEYRPIEEIKPSEYQPAKRYKQVYDVSKDSIKRKTIDLKTGKEVKYEREYKYPTKKGLKLIEKTKTELKAKTKPVSADLAATSLELAKLKSPTVKTKAATKTITAIPPAAQVSAVIPKLRTAPVTELKTETITKTKAASALKLRQVIAPVTQLKPESITKTTPILITETRTAVKTEQKLRTEIIPSITTPPPIVPDVTKIKTPPAIILPPLGGLRPGFERAKRLKPLPGKAKYVPSVTAALFDIKAPKGKLKTRGLTGLELRPIPGQTKKKKRKKR